MAYSGVCIISRLEIAEVLSSNLRQFSPRHDRKLHCIAVRSSCTPVPSMLLVKPRLSFAEPAFRSDVQVLENRCKQMSINTCLAGAGFRFFSTSLRCSSSKDKKDDKRKEEQKKNGKWEEDKKKNGKWEKEKKKECREEEKKKNGKKMEKKDPFKQYEKSVDDLPKHFIIRKKQSRDMDMKPHRDTQPQPQSLQQQQEQVDPQNQQLIVTDDGQMDPRLPHPIWDQEELNSVKVTHHKPENLVDHLAYYSVLLCRKGFDLASGYTIGKTFKLLDERSVLARVIFLETVAGVPGFAAAMIRHLHSLRRMQRDHGWIHTLLEEAENERMHLMTFMALRRPGPVLRASVIIAQWTFTTAFCLAYLISPHFCHRFVGYLEEQAVITYTHILEELDKGRLPMWEKLPAPEMAVAYWELPKDAVMRDVILAIRADEAHHRVVNHTLGSMDLRQKNPFKPGQ